MIAHALGAATGVAKGAAAVVAAVGLSAGGPPAPPLVDAACDERLVLRRGSALASAELDEVSGVVESRSRRGVLWMHNDSGDAARLFAVAPRRPYARSVHACGCRGAGLGGHRHRARPGRRASLPLRRRYRRQRPRPPHDLDLAPTRACGRAGHGADQPYRRRRGQARAALSGRCPRRGGAARGSPLRRPGRRDERSSTGAPASTEPPAGSPRDRRRPSGGSRRCGSASPCLVTGGDVSRSGSVVALRTYGSVLLFARPAGKPLWAAFAGRRCRGIAPPELQGEAIAVSSSGRSYVTVGEGAPAHLSRRDTRS